MMCSLENRLKIAQNDAQKCTFIDIQILEKEDITKWSNIQQTVLKDVKFLDRYPEHLDYVFNELKTLKLKGSRYMKYVDIHASDSSCKMTKDYPGVSDHLERCLELCSEHIKSNTPLNCNFKLQGKNILANNNGVFRQYIHTDYGYEEKKR